MFYFTFGNNLLVDCILGEGTMNVPLQNETPQSDHSVSKLRIDSEGLICLINLAPWKE